MNFLRTLLFPFSILYGIIIAIRNFLFDQKWLKSKGFAIPIISIGNISVGGSGKTPMADYLIRLLKTTNQVALLSRGYGRKKSGFFIANQLSTADDIGDEPLQYMLNHPDILVAVSEKRVAGVEGIQNQVDVIILDDAYQHRSIKPGFSILLFDYHKIFKSDFLLPSGNLREPINNLNRADIIVITKTNRIFSPLERRRVEAKMPILDHQKVFYSFIQYGDLKSLGQKASENFKSLNNLDKKTRIILFTGIAYPKTLLDYLEQKTKLITHFAFKDHHRYSLKDIKKITLGFDQESETKKIIITTEKDAMRLLNSKFKNFTDEFPVYFLPIQAEMNEHDKIEFDTLLTNYVATNTANNRIHKTKN